MQQLKLIETPKKAWELLRNGKTLISKHGDRFTFLEKTHEKIKLLNGDAVTHHLFKGKAVIEGIVQDRIILNCSNSETELDFNNYPSLYPYVKDADLIFIESSEL